MARVEVTYEFVQKAAQSAPVRAALVVKARQVQSRAEALAQSERVVLNSTVTDGTRPKGRPYSRVESPNVSQEWGSSTVDKRRILGRAAESS